ncbi:benzoate 4-monooxygenase cytochrome P450 [Penicillium angulare]|uniref:Benzoate 4-monooxygenase cytochrome P450 n=1 Tax=Penicillium angulare TaxID=116970 RepID=A0A9W9KQ44_9EURO|nr:benzoate 4-monooxygenase cytochrome P450 [Penicillium angulare]
MDYVLLLGFLLFCLCMKPVVTFLLDKKDLHKYHQVNFLAGFTSLAHVWEHRHRARSEVLRQKHQSHAILRLGPNDLSFADVAAIKDIYGHYSPCRKDDMYNLTAGSHGNMLNVVDRDEHARKRRMLSHAFSTKNLENWEFKIREKTEHFVKHIDQCCTSPLSDSTVKPEDLKLKFRLYSNLLTIDVIADIAMSEKLGMIEQGSPTVNIDGGETSRPLNFIRSLHGAPRVSSPIIRTGSLFQTLKFLSWWLSSEVRSNWGESEKFTKIVSNLASKNIDKFSSTEKQSDFLGYLMLDKAGGLRSLERGELEAELHILLDAGSDTTAIALTNAVYYLLKSPKVLVALRREIDEALSGETIAPFSKVKNLPFLRACIDEGLRLSPPIARGLERKTPPEGMRIMDQHIAGNVTVAVPTYVIHRNPNIFEDPDAYNPHRWFGEKEKVDQMRAAFIPFSTGGRACIGRNITFIEQQIVLATLVYGYEFALPSKNWELQREEYFNYWPSEMPLKVWKRQLPT